MTRKPESGNSMPPAKLASALRTLRTQIDKLDVQLVKLINERASHAAEIGRLKNEQGTEVFTPAREEEVIKNAVEAHQKVKGILDEATIKAVFREIMSGSRALQQRLKIAYLGPEFSYSYLAAVERFGQAVDMLAVDSIATVFEQVNRGDANLGVVPIDNTTDGRIADTLDMFIRLPQLRICAEIRLRVRHNLVASCEPGEVRRIYSKPQAISQCRNWIRKNYPFALVKDVGSTTFAAQLAREEKGAAAIANRQAAVNYGLRILFPDIEDSPSNETRFVVIGYQKAERTAHDKTSVMFRVSHAPGALVDALEVFRQAKINLTWIESFPVQPTGTGKPQYMFFVDFEGHAEDTKIAKTLKALQEHCAEMTVLGSYPVAEMSG
jgi:chorismate mutase/prephenate dehydratase